MLYMGSDVPLAGWTSLQCNVINYSPLEAVGEEEGAGAVGPLEAVERKVAKYDLPDCWPREFTLLRFILQDRGCMTAPSCRAPGCMTTPSCRAPGCMATPIMQGSRSASQRGVRGKVYLENLFRAAEEPNKGSLKDTIRGNTESIQ